MNVATVPLAVRRGMPSGVLAAGGCIVFALAALAVTLAVDAGAALSGHVYEDALTGVVWAALGLLLLRRAPGLVFGPLFVLVAASATLALCAGAYASLALRHDTAGVVPAAWLAGWVWAPGTFAAVTLLPLLFPDATFTRTVRVTAGTTLAGIALLCAGLATSPRVDVSAHASLPNPLAAPGNDALYVAGTVLVVASAVASWTTLVRRFAVARAGRRQQLAPVVVAVAISVPALLVAAALPTWGPLVQVLSMPLLPAAVAVAVLQYRLYDIEVVVRRSLLFLSMSALVIGGYVLIVQAITALLHRDAGVPGSVLATAVVALAFQPANVALQRGIGQVLYGERRTPLRALASVAEQLSGAADPQTALVRSLVQVRDALRLPWVAVHTVAGQSVETGPRPRWSANVAAERFPLTHLGLGQGELLAAPRSPREQLSGDDRRLLAQLAVSVAAVVAAGRLLGDLRASRERIVLAREEERRRLRRDLHDGLGPLLSALSVQADVLGLRLSRDPATARDLATRLQQTSADAVLGLRRVVEDLRPAGIDDLGLLGAVRAICESLAVSGAFTIDVHGTGVDELPAAVELAAYRIVGEAVTNAARHAGCRHVAVRLTAEADHLLVQIDDDGHGFAPEDTGPGGPGHRGVGLRSLRERAEELGGHLLLDSGASGTRVRAVLPTGTGSG